MTRSYCETLEWLSPGLIIYTRISRTISASWPSPKLLKKPRHQSLGLITDAESSEDCLLWSAWLSEIIISRGSLRSPWHLFAMVGVTASLGDPLRCSLHHLNHTSVVSKSEHCPVHTSPLDRLVRVSPTSLCAQPPSSPVFPGPGSSGDGVEYLSHSA